MCLILFAYNAHPRYRLAMLANRDEFYERATAPLHFWHDQPQVLAGRDLAHHGTWMGVTRTGRLAAITNYRDPLVLNADAPSRGHLVADFLTGKAQPLDYLKCIRAKGGDYNGFNLIVGDASGLFYYANRNAAIRILSPGTYGLSNHLLDTPWPKVRQGKNRLAALLQRQTVPDIEDLFSVLQDRQIAPDADLPQTGVDRDWERALSPIFIATPTYGTRSSSVLLIDRQGHLHFWERTWTPAQAVPVAQDTQHYELDVPGMPDGVTDEPASQDQADDRHKRIARQK